MTEARLTRVAAGAVLATLAAVLLNAKAILDSMMSVPDYASPLVMAHDAHLYPGADVVLGNFRWYPGFWVPQALGHLPLGDQLAAALPFLLTLLVAGLLAWQARRVWGTLPALLVAGMAVSIGTEAWPGFAAWSIRSPDWQAMGLAGIAAVAMARGERRAARAAAVATVVWGGMCLAGNKLDYAVILAPLAAAAAAAFWRGARDLAARLAGLAVLVVGAALVIRAIGDGAHLVQFRYDLVTVPYEQLGVYGGQAFTSLTRIWASPGSVVFGHTGAYVAAGIVLGSVVAVPAVLRDERGDLGRTVWTAFWAAAVAADAAAFALNSTSVVNGLTVPRYLYALPLAGGAVLAAVVGSGRARRLAPAAVAVVAAATAVSLFIDTPVRNPVSHPKATGAVLEAMREHDVDKGFGSYQTVYGMERAQKFAVPMQPVGPCAQGVCPFYLHRLAGAFEPQEGVRTFLLVDHSPMATPGIADWLTSTPPNSTPEETVELGDGLQMVIYDYDIARDFGPPIG